MVTKYFSIHSQYERQGLCHQKISLSVHDKACMRPITGVFYLSQLCPRVLPWITFVLLTDIFLNLGVNPLETEENYSIQFVVSLRWNTIIIRTPAFWGYPPPPPPPPWLHILSIHIGYKQDKVKVTGLRNLPKVQMFEFRKKRYRQHTFFSWLIKYVNIKWISGEYCWRYRAGIVLSTDGLTDRWTDWQTGWNQYNPHQFCWSGGIIIYKIALPLTSAPVLMANNDAHYIYICIYKYIYMLHHKPRTRLKHTSLDSSRRHSNSIFMTNWNWQTLL